MTVEGDPRKEALERVASEWLADLSPHGADVGEDAAMMATELSAALDASPAPDREKVAEAIGEALQMTGSHLGRAADAAIAALGAVPDPEPDEDLRERVATAIRRVNMDGPELSRRLADAAIAAMRGGPDGR